MSALMCFPPIKLCSDIIIMLIMLLMLCLCDQSSVICTYLINNITLCAYKPLPGSSCSSGGIRPSTFRDKVRFSYFRSSISWPRRSSCCKNRKYLFQINWAAMAAVPDQKNQFTERVVVCRVRSA